MINDEPMYPPPEEQIPSTTKDLLKNWNFTALFLGGLISAVGSNFSYIAMLFLVIHLTSHLPLELAAQSVSFIFIFLMIPNVLFGPFTGVVVDRVDRKKLMIFAELLGAGTSFGLMVSSELWMVYSLVFLSSFTRLIFEPAKGASIPRIVEVKDLVRANSLSQTVFQLSSLIGPALAGVTIARFGIPIAFMIDGISYMVSAFLILTIGIDLKPVTDGQKLTINKTWADIKKGLKLTFGERVIGFIMVFFLIAVGAIGMINPLLSFYLESTFNLGEEAFGYLISFSSISGLGSAVIISSRGQIKNKVMTILTTFGIIGGAMYLLGLAPSLSNPILWLYVAMGLIGMVNVLISIPLSTLLQTLIDNNDLGKVSSFMGTSLSIAQLTSGLTASYLVLFLTIERLFQLLGLFLFFLTLGGVLYVKATGLDSFAIDKEAEILIKKGNKQDDPISQIEVGTSS